MTSRTFDGTPRDDSAVSTGLTVAQLPLNSWSAEWGDHELKRINAQQKGDAAAHQREQNAKDNDLRRWIIKGIGLVILAVLIVGTCIATMSENDDTRKWAQATVALVFTGVIGAATGWLAKK